MQEYNRIEITRAPLIEHIKELRSRLVMSAIVYLLAFIICYNFASNIYEFLVRPLKAAGSDKMIYTNLTEGFFTQLKLSAFSAVFMSLIPIIVQLYKFVAPGLYESERRTLLFFLYLSPILFLAGAALVYYLVIPSAWEFFIGFENNYDNLEIKLEAKISEYLSLTMTLIIAFGMAFQLPLILALLAKFGMINGDFLKKKRRISVVLIFVAAAILTPPDIISQIGLAIPLILLYEFSVLICSYISRNRNA